MRKIVIAAALAAAVAAQPAMAAGTKTANMDVTLNVLNSCTLTTPTALDFGTQTVLTGATATGSAKVNCTIAAPYTLSISMGGNSASGSRRMTDGTNFVPYYININGASGDATGVGTGADQSFALSGHITATGSVPEGNYKDTVVVSLTY